MAGISKKCMVGGYRFTGRQHPSGNDVVDWFATNMEMPSKKAALAWMKEKRKSYAKHGIKVGFSYHETISKSYDIVMDDKTIKLNCFGRG